MTSKFLESDVVDSKIFAGRVLSLLGEIIQELTNQRRFLEEKFFLPAEVSREYREKINSSRSEEDEYVDEDMEDDE